MKSHFKATKKGGEEKEIYFVQEIGLKKLGCRSPSPHLQKEKLKREKKSACIVRHICFYRDCTKFTNITYMFHNFLFPISMY